MNEPDQVMQPQDILLAGHRIRFWTGGKLLADRGLSRLLRKDWPTTLEEMEKRYR